MKKPQINIARLKPFATLTVALFSTALITSCNNSTSENAENKADTATTVVEEKVADVKQDIQEYRDENFVADVVKANSQELHLIALAKQKGTDKEMKGHAKMMEPDHKKMGEEMKAYAAKKNYTATEDMDYKADLDDDAAGMDWDKKWVNKMVDEHEKVINKFEDAENRATDPELKGMITKTLPTLRKHLDMVKAMQDKWNK